MGLPLPGAIIIAIKILTFLLFVAILYSLASSLMFLVKDRGEGDRIVKRLAWRIGLSIVLFLSLWGAFQLGWIESNSGPVRVPPVFRVDE